MYQIYIKTLSGTTITVEVESWFTIKAIKEQIQETEGVPVENLRLIFAGKQLTNRSSLGENKIGGESVLHLIVRSKDYDIIQIYIKTLTNPIPLQVYSQELIEYVKEQIEKSEGIAVETQKFIYNGAILEDDKTLKDYSVQADETLTLELV